MQAYQTFCPTPQMNQPIMYPNYSQPMANPYMDRMAQLQQYQQGLQQPVQQSTIQSQQQPIGLNCRVVDDFNSITANDVPMDGNGAVFMKRDGSEMQWRNWAANGTIVTTPYKPILEQNQTEGTNMPQNDFTALNEDVRALREDIKGVREMIEKSMEVSSQKSTRGKKTEVVDNE